MIGQSYYPWWHGSLLDLRENLDFMAPSTTKTSSWWRWPTAGGPPNTAREPGRSPRRPKGQREFLDEVNRAGARHAGTIGASASSGGSRPSPGRLRSRGFFDDDGNALPVIQVFDRFTRR